MKDLVLSEMSTNYENEIIKNAMSDVPIKSAIRILRRNSDD